LSSGIISNPVESEMEESDDINFSYNLCGRGKKKKTERR
jgi:hypothetical protein